MSTAPLVVDVDGATFDRVVVEGSHQRPVLVDFWAEWCGPCRALAPVLEGVVADYAGALLLAKVDTDAERELALRFGIRSLPTVKLFVNGAVAGGFLGAQPESTIRALLEAHVPRESDALRARALALREAGKLAEARELLESAAASDPANPRIGPDLAAVLLELGELDAAERMLADVPAQRGHDDDWRRLGARLRFARIAREAPSEERLVERVDAEPGHCEARYRLAALRVTQGRYEEAMTLLIDVLRLDRSFGDDAARTALLAVFDLLSPGDPLVARYRAKLSSVLY